MRKITALILLYFASGFSAELLDKQTGSFTFGDTETVHDVTVSSYIPSQSVLFSTWRGGTDVAPGQVRFRKLNSTTLRFERGNAFDPDPTVNFELMSYNSDVSVQDITRADFGTVTVSAVNLSRSWIIHGGNLASSGSTVNSDDYNQVRFNSTTEVEFRIAGGGSNVAISVAAQVIDYAGCSVQDIVNTYTTTTNTSETASVSSVDLSATILFSSSENSATGTFDDDFWRATLTNATTITYDRVGTASETVTFRTFIVEFTDGTVVQSGQHTLAHTDATDDVTITAIDITESTAIFSGAQWISLASGSAGVNDDRFKDAVSTAELVNSTTLRITRSSSVQPANYLYQVITWNTGASAPLSSSRRRVL